MSRTLISATYETDRSFVTAKPEDSPYPGLSVYYYADSENAEVPFVVEIGLPIGGLPLWLPMTTEELGKWLLALGQLYNDAIRDGR